MRIRVKSFWPAVGMLILATVLFCIPGNTLPDEDWLGKISADKLIHVGLFAALVALWGFPFVARAHSKANSRSVKSILIWLVAVAVVYGIVIEIIQGAYIPNRSYSLADMVADAIGSVVGGLFVSRQSKATATQ